MYMVTTKTLLYKLNINFLGLSTFFHFILIDLDYIHIKECEMLTGGQKQQ